MSATLVPEEVRGVISLIEAKDDVATARRLAGANLPAQCAMCQQLRCHFEQVQIQVTTDAVVVIGICDGCLTQGSASLKYTGDARDTIRESASRFGISTPDDPDPSDLS